jgi:hypothetical protein
VPLSKVWYGKIEESNFVKYIAKKTVVQYFAFLGKEYYHGGMSN